jgi:hypothetical protein
VNEHIRRITGIGVAGVANSCEPILGETASAAVDSESVRGALKAVRACGVEIAEDVVGVAE